MLPGPIRLVAWGATAAVLLLGVTLGAAEPAGAVHTGLRAEIRRGTCADLGESIAELDLGYREPVVGTPAATPTGTFTQPDPQQAIPVVTDTTTIDVPLAQLTETPHAVTVLISDESEATATPIMLACGVVGGVPAEDDLVFGLQSLGVAEACTTGIGWLHALDGQTRVVLFVTQGLCPEETGIRPSPAAGTPAP